MYPTSTIHAKRGPSEYKETFSDFYYKFTKKSIQKLHTA